MNSILFTIYSLRGGGAERIMSTLANHLIDSGFQVTIVTISKANNAYKISPKIKVIELGLNSNNCGLICSLKHFLIRIISLNKQFRIIKPDLCISFMTETNIISIISGKINKVPVIVAERTNPAKHKISFVYSFLRRRLYKYANSVVVQTASVSDFYIKNLKLKNLEIIPNFIKLDQFKPLYSKENKIILSIGRLSFEKGHLSLVEAFAVSDAIQLGWELKIVGSGPLEDFLREKVKKLGIGNYVEFEGASSNVYDKLSRADIFVLPSNYEGFPNVLMEALAVGVPSISTNCEYGPADLITSGANGLLVEVNNVNDLKNKLNILMSDSFLRNQFRIEGPMSIQKFDYNIIINKWDTLIKELIKKNT